MLAKFLTVLFLASVYLHDVLGREYVTREISGSTFSYKIHASASSWEEAERTCQSEDAHLAVVKSEAEAKVLGSLIDSLGSDIDKEDPTNAPHDFYAIGLSKDDNSKVWKTIFGTPLDNTTYTNWAPQHPGPFFYIPLFGYIDNEGKFYGFSHDEEGFICKK